MSLVAQAAETIGKCGSDDGRRGSRFVLLVLVLLSGLRFDRRDAHVSGSSTSTDASFSSFSSNAIARFTR